MSPVFEALQRRYHDLVARASVPSPEEDVWDGIRIFLEDARRAGSAIPDPGERALLRAYMRFLAVLLHQRGETPPTVELLPPERGIWPETPPARRPAEGYPAWFWGLVGAAVLVVVAGLLAVIGGSGGYFAPALTISSSPTPVPSLTPTFPLPTPSPTAPPTPPPGPILTPTPTVPPTFGALTVALGVLPTGEPVLVGNEFDWNTRVVYAVFDYAGMRPGTPWSVVWTRNGREIARENHLWDGGPGGTAWVVYFNPDGTVLPGGEYRVSLYIEDRLQAEASFRIRYYIVRTPTPTP